MLKLLAVLVLFGSACNSAPEALPDPQSLVAFEDASTPEDRWGYKDAGGAVVIAPRFVVAEAFSAHGLAAVADDTGWHYINAAGETVIRPFVFDNGPDPFREGLARFVEGGRFGFFDERGTVVVPAQFDFATSFDQGRAAFCLGCWAHHDGEHTFYQGGRWGFLHHLGNTILAAQFEEAGRMANDNFRMTLDGHWAALDSGSH